VIFVAGNLPYVSEIAPLLIVIKLEGRERSSQTCPNLRRLKSCKRLMARSAVNDISSITAVGEYGSVIFVAGNLPYVSEIAPLLIVIKLEEFNYAGLRHARTCGG
jgi:ABC-type sulfate transport system permease component